MAKSVFHSDTGARPAGYIVAKRRTTFGFLTNDEIDRMERALKSHWRAIAPRS